MSDSDNTLIDALVADLNPVRPLSQTRGLMQAMAAMLVLVVVVVFGLGLRGDLLARHADPIFLLSSGLFFLLSCASVFSVVQMSRPYVGNHQTGWLWASAMAGLLPLSALLIAALELARGNRPAVDTDGWECLSMGCLLGIAVGAVLVLWLRRGAPTSPERAGLLTGIAAGSSGIFAFALHCPHNDLAHIGLWHGLAVVVSALVGRLIVPAAIRW